MSSRGFVMVANVGGGNTYSSISLCGSVKVSLLRSRYEVATTSDCVQANQMGK